MRVQTEQRMIMRGGDVAQEHNGNVGMLGLIVALVQVVVRQFIYHANQLLCTCHLHQHIMMARIT